MLLARGRWNLDHGLPIAAPALAILGGVSQGRMRNMLSGKTAVFHSENGMVPAHEALGWLQKKDTFFPSIWRDERIDWSPGDASEPELEDPLFVPEARDGSVFHPGLTRRGQYTVGSKGEEVRYENFDEALQALTRMPIPRWRQPGKGTAPSWSLVTGLSWKRTTMSELKAIGRSLQAAYA